MIFKKREYKSMPDCKICEYNNVCHRGEKECTKYTGWVRPCLQGCIEHDKNCFIENGVINIFHRSLKDCDKYKK